MRCCEYDVAASKMLWEDLDIGTCRDLGLSAMMNTNSFVDTIKGLGTLQWSATRSPLGLCTGKGLLISQPMLKTLQTGMQVLTLATCLQTLHCQNRDLLQTVRDQGEN